MKGFLLILYYRRETPMPKKFLLFMCTFFLLLFLNPGEFTVTLILSTLFILDDFDPRMKCIEVEEVRCHLQQREDTDTECDSEQTSMHVLIRDHLFILGSTETL